MTSTQALAKGSADEEGMFDAPNRQWLGFWAILMISSAPLLLPYLASLWTQPHYGFFPFAFLVTGGLVYFRWDRLSCPPRGLIGWGMLTFGIMINVAGIMLASPWLGTLGLFIVVTAWLFSIKSREGLSLSVAAIPLFLMMRLPLGYDQVLTIQLQRLTTKLVSVLLDALSVPHLVDNNILTLVSRDLFVAEACSGIQSVFTLMFLSMAIVTVFRRSLWMTPFYLAGAMMLALAANVVRVGSVAVGQAWFSVDLAEGWQHDFLGYTVLLLATVLLLSFDQLAVMIFHPFTEGEIRGVSNPLIDVWNFFFFAQSSVEEMGVDLRKPSGQGQELEQHPKLGRSIERIWTTGLLQKVTLVFLGAVALAGTVQAIQLNPSLVIAAMTDEILWEPAPDALDGVCETLKINKHERSRNGANPRLGRHADVWECAVHQRSSSEVAFSAQLTLSQTYTQWHELCLCYENLDWILLNRTVVTPQANKGDHPAAGSVDASVSYAQARFKNSGTGHSYLLYSGMNSQAQIVTPPPLRGRLVGRFRYRLQAGQPELPVMMLQLLVTSPQVLSPSQLRDLSRDFVRVRMALTEKMSKERRLDASKTQARSNGLSPELVNSTAHPTVEAL